MAALNPTAIDPTADQELRATIQGFAHDPLGFVRFVFP